MSQPQEPGLNTGGSSGYRRGGGRKAPAGGGGASRSLGTNLIVALLVAGLVLAGWFIANQQQMLTAEQSRVSAANDRIQRLEDRLIATDSALSQGGEDTQEQIGLWESEIRKLWAVSNERNKKWIKDNESGLAKVSKSLNGIEASNRDLKAAVGRHESAFAQQQELIDRLTSIELQFQQIVRGQRDLVDKVNAATQTVASLKASLSGQVKDNSEAVQSIDAFRVAINSRLKNLEDRINSLGGGASSGGR
ncbi:MAG: hypothetical protein AAF513_13420 [Pseudomonadota bacterium]